MKREEFVFPIPFSDDELKTIRRHYDPDGHSAFMESERNRIWAKPVEDVLVPRFQREVARVGGSLNVGMVLVGEDTASRSYVDHFGRLLEKCGIESDVREIKESDGQKGLEEELGLMSEDPDIIGIIPQLPLPEGFSEEEMRMSVAIEKDIDMVHPVNLERFTNRRAPFLPATMGGIAMALHTYNISLIKDNGKAKDIAILGQGNLVGVPLTSLFRNVYGVGYHAMDVNTDDLPFRLQNYDVIVSATGRAEIYDERILHVKNKQVLLDIDFGMREGRVVGGFTEDAHAGAYASLRNPGGSGLFTRLFAVHNVLTMAERRVRENGDEDFSLYSDRKT